MLIRRKSDLLGSNRHIKNHAYETVRFLLEPDGAGVTMTDIMLGPGIKETYGYKDHIEIAYCISGKAELQDLGTLETHLTKPGIMWFTKPGETFTFTASEPTRLICIFNPAFKGEETGFASSS
jgi:L-ectoine synthase